MSDWGDSFVNGFTTMQDIKEKRARRLLEEEMQNRKIAADAEAMKQQFAGQGGLQDSRQRFEADQAAQGRTFTTGRDATLNSYDTAKLDQTQNWQGGQNDANRNVTTSEGAANRGLSEREATAKLLMDAKGLQQHDEKFSWDKDPANPENIYKTAQTNFTNEHADYLRRGGEAAPILTNSTAAFKNGTGTNLPTLTPEQAMGAKPGTRYKTNDGRIMTR